MEDVLVAEKENGVQSGIVKFNVTDSEIAKMKEDFMSLTIDGLEDKAGLKKVYESRQQVKKIRVGIEKYAKELKEQAIAWQKKVNTEKDRVISELEAIENYLQAEEDKIAVEKERLRLEKERAEQKVLQDRVDQLQKFDCTYDLIFLKGLSNEAFGNVLDNARIEFERVEAEKVEQERLRVIREEELKKEREELEVLRKKQAEADAIINAEKERVKREAEETERQRVAARYKRFSDLGMAEGGMYLHYNNLIKIYKDSIDKATDENLEKMVINSKAAIDQFKSVEEEELQADIERQKSEAAESARKQLLMEQEQQKEADRLAVLKEKRQEALRPDKEKLLAFVAKIGSILDFTVKDDKAQQIVDQVAIRIGAMQKYISEKVADL